MTHAHTIHRQKVSLLSTVWGMCCTPMWVEASMHTNVLYNTLHDYSHKDHMCYLAVYRKHYVMHNSLNTSSLVTYRSRPFVLHHHHMCI